MLNVPGVYILRFPSGLYVGSSKHMRRRCLRHIADLKRGTHSNRFLQSVYEKHGVPTYSVYRVCEERDLLFHEQRAIDMLFPRFNLAPTAGRNLGHRHSEETRERMRQAGIEAWKTRDRNVSDEARRLLSVANIGRRHTVEARAKISESKKGKLRSSEHKAAISAGKKGRKINQRGHVMKPEWVRKAVVSRLFTRLGIPYTRAPD